MIAALAALLLGAWITGALLLGAWITGALLQPDLAD
jgi:hypothetical protein